MKSKKASPFLVSLGAHILVLVLLGFLKYTVDKGNLQTVLDSVFTEERTQEEFEREADTSTQVAESMNFIAGTVAEAAANASSSGGGGGGGGGGSGGGGGGFGDKIGSAGSLAEPNFALRPGPISVPGVGTLGNDLGAGQVTGEVGRVVEGYGAALGQITQELVRMMRQERIHACWLFDASESMEDDRKEIRDNFHKVYEEMGLVTQSDNKLKVTDEPILTSIFTFNAGVNELTPKPTADLSIIRTAIDKISKDESGEEKFCGATASVIEKYSRMARSQKRKLVIIMVSDESGDDGASVEEAIDRCKRVETPVYFLGRYAVFGFPYAQMTWKDPKYGLTFWLPINRGPETAFPECLQFDGLHSRWDIYSSGFGPYEQVRLCRETGGIFFLLPGNEDNLSGRGSQEERKYEMLNMKEYLPDLSPRSVSIRERDSSKFRSGLWQIIVKLNPFLDDGLQMQEHHFSADRTKFTVQGGTNFNKAVKALKTLNEANAFLETLKPLREKEKSERWRAHYDLMHAQCLGYRVRLFQYILALDQHQALKLQPTMKTPDGQLYNEWHLDRVQKMLPPTPAQVKQAGIDLDELNEQEKKSKAEFVEVVKKHPGTPWAKLAQRELDVGFGLQWREGYRDPRYDREGIDIKKPKP